MSNFVEHRACPNREKRLEQKREYYRRNRERILAKQKEYNKQNRERNTEYFRKYFRENYQKRFMANTKNKAKSRGLEFDLTLDDFEIPEFCPMTGIKLEKSIGERRINSPSIDRIDRDKGYVKGNTRVVSWWYNFTKYTMSDQEVLELCRQVVERAGS